MSDTSSGWGELLAVVRRRENGDPFAEPDRRAALDLAMSVSLATLPGAVGCSISERQPDGSYRTPAAAGEVALILDEVQYVQGDGPCLRAARSGDPVQLDLLATEERWPDLARAAAEHSVASSLSLPLLTARTPAALNLYGGTEAAFASTKVASMAGLIARTTSTLMSGPSQPIEGLNLSRLRWAMRERTLITRAQGALMAREGLSADVAYHRLALRSAEVSSPLRDVAERVLEGPGSADVSA